MSFRILRALATAAGHFLPRPHSGHGFRTQKHTVVNVDRGGQSIFVDDGLLAVAANVGVAEHGIDVGLLGTLIESDVEPAAPSHAINR